jgi:protein TonB
MVCAWLICAAAFASSGERPLRAQASTVRVVGAQEAAQHLLKRIEPRYPAIAGAAHVEGSVPLLADVSETGKVSRVAVVASIPMLDQAARDAVKAASFAPFTEDGSPVPALVSAIVSFDLRSGRAAVVFDDSLSQAIPLVTDCQRTAAKSLDGAAISVCRRAVDATTSAGPGASAWRMRALWLLGRGQAASGLLTDAVRSLDEAARPVHLADGSGVYPPAEILADAARIHVAAGDVKGASNLFTRAEIQVRGQLDQLKPDAPDRSARASGLRSLLTEHAAALRAAGLTTEADQASQQAADVR